MKTVSATDWATLMPVGTVQSVVINSPPVVSFQIKDGSARPVTGLSTSLLRFTLAKLVPGAKGSPSKWVNYVVGDPATGEPSRPSTENVAANLAEVAPGQYTYTFARDITGPLQASMLAWFGGAASKDASSTRNGVTTVSTYAKADVLGSDGNLLAYDPSLTHRLVIQLSGTVNGVSLANPIDVVYDWIPATGQVVAATDTQREIVATAKCNECHTKIGVTTPHGGRVDTRYCVTCHTDQRKNGQAEATIAGNVYSGSTYKIAGMAVGNFPVFIHKIHGGEVLTKTGYNYADVKFNETLYPQPITNCVKCHDGSATSTAKTTQGDNWKLVPSALVCGSCHDGIDFKTGLGTALGARGQLVGGHVGGAQASDVSCALCHDAATIPVYHVTVDPTGANGRGGYPLNTADNVPTPGYPSGQGPSIPVASQVGKLPAGVYKIDFEIKSASVAANKATVVYRILKDGAPVTFNAAGMLMDNVDGTPDIYVAYATAQDGLAAPADWNGSKSAHIIDIRDGKSGNSQTGPDASGYYTATLGAALPADAKMVTAAIGINYNGFVQLGLSAYPKGIRLREPEFVMKTATGFTARRSIVDNAKCNSCHGQLGISPSFHSGARNNGEGCAIGGCHDANKNTGHTGAANSFGGGWSVAAKNLIHGIHGGGKRAQAFSYEATADNPGGFQEVKYPAILSNCEQCHVAGSYDFSATANKAALPNLLWITDAKTDMTNAGNAPSIGLSPWVTTLGAGQTDYSTNNLVSSPIASSCFGCHDSTSAVAHMQLNGGTLVTVASKVTVSTTGDRAAGFSKVESCTVCHGSGKDYDIKAVHAK